jgi:two-component system, cell cycle response regulator
MNPRDWKMHQNKQLRLYDVTPARDGRLRVLLLEHKEADAKLMVNLIQKGGRGKVEIVWASSFADALMEMRKQPFDAMLLDLFAPDSEGIEAIRRVSDRADIPIIALTKESDDGSGIDALLAGAEDNFVKEHVNSHNMVRAIEYAIARHRRIGELHALSLVDELTGIYNRRAFMTLGDHQLKIARREHAAVTLAFADLDGLKAINDQCGHMWGDFALKDIASILKNTFRECDVIARIGGDEFAILWISHAPLSSEALQSRLKLGVEAHSAADPRPYRLSLSIGFSHYSAGFTESLEDMLFETDRRMYAEKRNSAGVTGLQPQADPSQTR